MKSLIFSALIAAAQLPAGTADDVACVVDRTSPADRLAIGEGAFAPAASPGPPAEAGRRVGAHLAACADQQGWDEPQTLRISSLVVATFVHGLAQQRLVGAGVDVAALDLWFERQSEEFRINLHSMPADEVDATFRTLADDVMPAALLDAQENLIAGYVAMRIIFMRVEAGLPIE